MKAGPTTTELFARALAHHQGGRVNEAQAGYRKVVARDPGHHQAHFSLGGLCFEAGRFADAVEHLERAVAVRPKDPMYLTNLGEACRRQGELERAATAFERVLAEDPEFPEAHHNLGLTLMNAGAPVEALPHLERAAALRPDDPSFQVSLAWALLQLHRVDASIAHCTRALALAPHFAPAHHHLANALVERGDRGGAIASYRKAFQLDPADHDAHSNLILVTLTDPSYDAAALLAEARRWAKLHAEPMRSQRRPHTNDKNPERRLRIGYVSPDFRAHPVRQFMMPLLAHHNPQAVEVYLYASVERPDFATEQYRALAGDRFRDIRRLDDPSAAELVRHDQIDILVDLALHGAGRRLRLFACKPAPVQMTWLGYAGTTGLDTIDYRLTDPFVDPPGSDLGVYAETSLRLPETSWCYAPLESGLEVAPLPARTAGFITFGGQNSYRKVHAGVLALWARVLREVPGSRLCLYAEEYAREAIRRTLEGEGIHEERLEFGGRVSRREYLERYHRIDIALDTFPFAGATTSLDAIWMGVPVVTLSGATALHRAGASIAMNLGRPELIANSQEQFVAIATALARDIDRIAQLRGALRGELEASPLGNAPRFAEQIEVIFRTAWRRHCAGD